MTEKEFYKKWFEVFAQGISDKQIQKYVVDTGNYIWHIFSFELIDMDKYLVGDEAKKAYNSIDKNGALYVELDDDNGVQDVTWELSRAEEIDKFCELYVVGRDFEWTYIKTHEPACGPYFFKIK